MDSKVTRCQLVFDYIGADGMLHFHSDCGLCSMLQMSYSPTGPWYDERVVEVGQDIQIMPNDMTNSAQYFRLIPWACVEKEKAVIEVRK